MLLTTLANLRIPGGRIRRWAADAAGDGAPHPVGPSENERFHLEAVRAGGSGWLAMTAELPTVSVDPDRLLAAFAAVVDHHEVLRSHFVLDADGTPRRRVHERGAISLRPVGAVHTVDERAIRDELATAVSGCTALAPASHVLAVVESACVSTVVCAFDHCYVDAHSLAVIAEDLVAAYAGDPLSAAGSFLDHLAATTVDAPDDDPGVRGWAEFLAATDHTVPAFPLDLGVVPGEFAPSRIHVTQVLSRAEADAHTESGTRRRVRTYPMLLTALAQATRDHGGPDRLPVVLPIHTRTDDASSRAVGWCVANAPVIVDAGPRDTADPEQILRAATAAVTDALPLAGVDLTSVYARFGHLLRKPRHDVFMVSYLDYRRFSRLRRCTPGTSPATAGLTTSSSWFWRDDDGIGVRARFPDTAAAAPLVTSVVDDLVARARAAVPVWDATAAPV